MTPAHSCQYIQGLTNKAEYIITAALFNLVIIKYQRAHLDALPRWLIIMSRVRKGSMWNPPCAAIIDRVIAFYKQRLIRTLSILEVPLMAWVRLDDVGFTLAIWIDQGCGNKIAVRH